MKRTWIVQCLLIMASTVASFGQARITGNVVDKSGLAVPFATAVLHKATDSLMVKGALADERGSYVFEGILPGQYFVRVQQVGSIDQQSPGIAVVDTSAVRIEPLTLIERVKNLQEVTVKTQRSLVERVGNKLVMNVENSVITKGNKATDLLKYVPQVKVSPDGGITVGNKANVLILVDGKQMGEAATAGFLQSFSAEDIIKVEVTTNPSVQYDASYGSVINIVTKKSLTFGATGRATLTYSQGQYGRLTPDASVTFRGGKWNIFGSVSTVAPGYYYTTQQFTRYFPDGALRSDLRALNATKSLATNVGIEYALTNKQTIGVRLNSKWTREDGRDQTQSDILNRNNRLDSSLHTTNQKLDKTQVYDLNLNYRAVWGKNGQELRSTVTQSFLTRSASQDIVYQYNTNLGEPYGTPAHLRITNPTNQQNLIAQVDYGQNLFSGKLKLETGVRYAYLTNRNQLNQYVLSAPVNDSAIDQMDITGFYTEQTLAGFVNLQRTLKNGLTFQAGLRQEQTHQLLAESNVSRTYAGLFPSFSVNRSLPDGQAWGVSYSRKITRPRLKSLVPYRYYIDRYTAIEGNPLLRPTYFNTVDVYYTVKKFNFFANYSYKQDAITVLLRPTPGTYVYTQVDANLRAMHEYYAGLTLNHTFTNWWQTNTTLTGYGNNTKTAANEVTSYQSSGVWADLYSTNLFSLSNNWKYELTLSYTSPVKYALLNQKSIYGVSMALNKALWNKSANLRIAVQDVFRTQRSRVLYNYGFVDLSMQTYTDDQRVRVAFSYNFGKKTVKTGRAKSLENETEKSRMGGQ